MGKPRGKKSSLPESSEMETEQAESSQSTTKEQGASMSTSMSTQQDHPGLSEVESGSLGKGDSPPTLGPRGNTEADLAEYVINIMAQWGVTAEILNKYRIDDFQKPRKIIRKCTIEETPQTSFANENRFNSIAKEAEVPERQPKKNYNKKLIDPQPERTPKEIKYPPILAVGLENPREFMKTLPQHVKYEVAFNNGVTRFMTKDKQSHDNIFNILRETKGAGGFTHTAPEDKKKNLILRGLGYYIETEDIEEDLKSKGIDSTVRRITTAEQRANGKRGHLFSIMIKPADIDVLRNIRSVCDHKASWEEPRKRSSIQCSNCMRTNHTASKCAYATRCAYCGDDHFSKNCLTQSKPSCVLCKEDGHAATLKDCPWKISELQRQDDHREKMENKKLWELKKKKQLQQDTLQLTSTELSFASALKHGKSPPQDQPRIARTTKDMQQELGSFLDDTAQELFGTSYSDYFDKVQKFKIHYSNLTDNAEKRKAFANFVLQCA